MMRATLACLFILTQALASGQSASARRDSVRLLIAGMKAAIARIDSSGPSKEAVEARLELAPLLKGKEALALLDMAAALADSMRDAPLGVEARMALATRLSSTGNHKRAYAEMMRIVALRDQIAVTGAERSAKEADRLMLAHAEEQDSLIADRERRIAEAKESARRAEERTGQWILIAGVALAASFLLIAVIVIRSGVRMKRFRIELQGLRAEVEELKKPRNVYRGPAAPPPVESVAAPAEAPPGEPSPLRLPPDPMVSAMFLRQAPERLAALKEARARGDLEKAVRVVHTLKPTLVSIDAARFTELCARLVAPGAAGTPAWNADTDALAAMIEALLEQS